MGLFDSFITVTKCPYCGTEDSFEFQTKKLDCSLEVYYLNEDLNKSGSSKNIVIKDAISGCKHCKNEDENLKVFFGDIIIKNNKFVGIKKVKKRVKQ